MTVFPDRRRAILLGAVAGIGAGLAFATAHAILIVPIWDRMIGGLGWAAAAGAIAAWTYTELYPEAAAAGFGARAAAGARFGALLWFAVAPVSLVDAVLRAIGVLPRLEILGVAVALLLAVATGAALGWWRTKTRRGMIAGGAATLFLTFSMAGPVPIGRSSRALSIFLSVLPAATLGGALLGVMLGHQIRGLRTSKVSVVEDRGSRVQN